MYEAAIATHYAAYRPPLHKAILQNVLDVSRNRRIGLDVGCGTGRSSHALANFCNFVIGIDPGMAMLRETQEQKAINYVNAPGEKIPIAENTIDVVTMAGSLNYIDRKLLVGELERISRHDVEIVTYDFEIDLSSFEKQFMLQNSSASPEYDHLLNLSEFTEVKEIRLVRDEVPLDLGSREITHLLLSDTNWHGFLRERFCPKDLFELIKTEIETIDTRFTLNARFNYSLYSLPAS